MSDTINQDNLDQTNQDGQTPPASSTTNDETVAKLVAEKVQQELSSIKKKLDDAYASRDEAVKKAALFEEQQKSVKLKQLEEEGKHKEVYEMKLAELAAKYEAASARNIELSRDLVVRDALKGLDFRNEVAAEMGYKDILNQLVQDENGQWVHKTGVSIKEFVNGVFAKDEDKSFLFKPKTTSGAGTQQPSGTPKFDPKKSLFEMSQEEVLALATQGKIGNAGSF
jgi:hypothetical protein